jgi:hypothetical protein
LANFCQRSPGILPSSEALAVHHLVVRERQHEVLAEGVDQAEGQLALVGPVDRVARKYFSVSCIQPMFHL